LDDNAFFGLEWFTDPSPGSNSRVYAAIGDNGLPGDPGTFWRRVISAPGVTHNWGSNQAASNDQGIKIIGFFQSEGIQPVPLSTNGENAGAVCVAFDGCLTGQTQRSFELDAILTPAPATFIVDGIALVTPGRPFSVDAILVGLDKVELFLIDARLKVTKNAPLFNINALIGLLDQEETFTIDGSTKFFNQVAPMTVDALIGLPQSKFVLYDGILKALNVVNFHRVDGLIQQQDNDLQFTVGARIGRKEQIREFFVDGIPSLPNQTVTFDVTASLAVTQPPVQFGVDAQILLDNHRYRIDALLQLRVDRTIAVDVIISDPVEVFYDIDAIVKALGS
jgi:hypothetical protein